MGLNPICAYLTAPEEAREFIYTCVESGLPVIAGIPGHVVVVIGHDYDKRVRFGGRMHSMSESVKHFIVHDDALGPYRKVRTRTALEAGKGKKVRLLTLDDKPVDFCLVAMPPRVHLTAEDVWDTARLWIAMIRPYVQRFGNVSQRKLRRLPTSLKGLVLRIYLRLSGDFKEDLAHQREPDCRDEVITSRYLCMPMPKYVWVIELARQSDLRGQSPHDRMIRGEIILDSTGNKRLPEETLLAFHMDGTMFIPERPGRDAELVIAPPRLYRPLQRGAQPCVV
jgi:hypothetical protein